MAGSYSHCVDREGEFIGENFQNMIENLGDAYEACEQMVFMLHAIGDALGDHKAVMKWAENEYFHSVNPGEHPEYPFPVHGRLEVVSETVNARHAIAKEIEAFAEQYVYSVSDPSDERKAQGWMILQASAHVRDKKP